jgi:ABC-type Fe3+-hydroxamate transport system substrate-binding protein
MGQRRLRRLGTFLAILLSIGAGLAAPAGCERPETSSDGSAATSTRPTPAAADRRVTVASLVPAATDLILFMGAGDRLVAVSNYDVARDGTRGLPRVGDYENTDWEQLRALRPNVMIRQFAPDRMPPGLKERSDELGVAIVNLQIERVDDIFKALDVLGATLHEPALAAAARQKLQTRLDAVRARTASLPKVRTLIVLDDAATAVIGPDTFHDDLLAIAGGTNIAERLGSRYPSIDREMLRSMDPDAIIQLLPEASPQVRERAAAVWKDLGDLRAVRDGRVYTITDWYALLPASQVATLAEQFAAALHPAAASPTTRAAP